MIKYLKFLAIALFATTSIVACNDDDDDAVGTFNVDIQLVFPEDDNLSVIVPVTLTNNSTGVSFVENSDESGMVSFTLTSGQYDAVVSAKNTNDGGEIVIYTGTKTIDVNGDTTVDLELSKAEFKEGVVIKELYFGGLTDENSKAMYYGKYVTLHNNSMETQTLSNLCLGMVLPYNSNQANNDYLEGGSEPFYAAEGWIPAGAAFWAYNGDIVIEAGAEVTIAIDGAIDHSATYADGVNLSMADYACYDVEVLANPNYYPAPAASIPSSNYLDAYLYGLGNAWALSASSPAFFLFSPEGQSPEEFANDQSNVNYHGGTVSASRIRKKVPVSWVIDAVEIERAGVDNNVKRLTNAVDAGWLNFTGKLGYTAYRNVDKDATEAILENEGKIIYNYDLGTTVNGTTSTDPSGIDAEASIANGAHIIFQDTNNSSNDFHQRAKSSLRQ